MNNGNKTRPFFKPLHADSGLDSFNPFATGIDMPVVLWSSFSMSYIFLFKVRAPMFLGGGRASQKGQPCRKGCLFKSPLAPGKF